MAAGINVLFILVIFATVYNTQSVKPTVCIGNDKKIYKIGSVWKENNGRSVQKCQCDNSVYVGAKRTCSWTSCLTNSGKEKKIGDTWKEAHTLGGGAPASSAENRCTCIKGTGDKPTRDCSWSHCFTREGKAKSKGDTWTEVYVNINNRKSCKCKGDPTDPSMVKRTCQWTNYCYVPTQKGMDKHAVGSSWKDDFAKQNCKCNIPYEHNYGPPTAFCVYYAGCPDFVIANKWAPLGTKMGTCTCKYGKSRNLNYDKGFYWDCDNPPTCELASGARLTLNMEYNIGSGDLEQNCKCKKIPGRNNPHVVCVYIKGCYSDFEDMQSEKHNGYFRLGTTRNDGCICVKGEVVLQSYKGVHYRWNCDNSHKGTG